MSALKEVYSHVRNSSCRPQSRVARPYTRQPLIIGTSISACILSTKPNWQKLNATIKLCIINVNCHSYTLLFTVQSILHSSATTVQLILHQELTCLGPSLHSPKSTHLHDFRNSYLISYVAVGIIICTCNPFMSRIKGIHGDKNIIIIPLFIKAISIDGYYPAEWQLASYIFCLI